MDSPIVLQSSERVSLSDPERAVGEVPMKTIMNLIAAPVVVSTTVDNHAWASGCLSSQPLPADFNQHEPVVEYETWAVNS